jgi:hypothetical protein
MDAFTGKEQNRANVVPMVCQLKMGRNFKSKKQIVIVPAVVGRKANCNFRFFMVR